MATKTAQTGDRLAAAKIKEGQARDALTALRERHKLGKQPVTGEEFTAAGVEVELAVLEREGAEAAFAEAVRQERLAKLARISADIAANAHRRGRLRRSSVSATRLRT